MNTTRRQFLGGLGAAGFATLAGTLARAQTPGRMAFNPDMVVQMARELAAKAYKPAPEVPEEWSNLTFDQYRDIRFNAEKPLWTEPGQRFQLQLLPSGYGYRRPVLLSLVENGEAFPLPFRMADFLLGPLAPPLPAIDGVGHSGFRLHTALNRFDYADEFMVFHGASYFRGIGRGQTFGLSARGLPIDTIKPGREEFPDFQRFWIETPRPGASTVRIHALLESKSITGAFQFDVTPGEATIVDVRSMLFPRRDLVEAGIAPLTSMFYFNGINRPRFDDYRPAAHDSDGLLIATGSGGRIWRPLMNNPTFEVSWFADADPRGFGLMQRARDWRDYRDLALAYHARPSLWIEPQGDWGEGSVVLVEIPVEREDVDNIVAFWRPKQPLKAGESYAFDYRMRWGGEPDAPRLLATVERTSIGPHHEGGRLIVIDFKPAGFVAAEVEPDIWASAGEVYYPVVQDNPDTGGVRLFFGLRPGPAKSIELGATLKHSSVSASETWLYRWIA